MENNYRESLYAKSLVCPTAYQSYYPDYNQTTSHLKSITLTKNLECLGNSFLLVHKPLNPDNNQILSLYVPDTVRGGYTFCTHIEPDEDMSENYSRARIVSGGLKCISTTISPSITFSVNGVITAADVQTLPPTRSLTYQQILSYRRNPIDHVNTSVSKGIMSLMHPEGDNRFRLLESSASENTDNVLYNEYFATGPESQLIGWVYNDPQFTYYELTVENGGIPADVTGLIEIEFAMEYAVGLAGVLSFSIETLHKDPNDWVTDIIEVIRPPGGAANVGIQTGQITRAKIYCNNPLSKVTFMGPNTTAANVIRLYWSFTSTEYYQLGTREPCTLIGIDGVTPSQPPVTGTIISLSGQYNYETVPNAQLARQLTTTTKRTPESAFTLMGVMNMIQNHEIKFLWPLAEYNIQCESKMDKLSNLSNIANASGVTDIMRAVGRLALPVATGIATAVNPILGTTVNQLGRALQGDAAGLYKFNPPRRGYMASVTDPAFLDPFKSWKGDSIPLATKDDDQIQIKFNPLGKGAKGLAPLVASSTSANARIALTRGMITQMAFEWIGAYFPIIAGDLVRSIGRIIWSALPLNGNTYKAHQYQVTNQGTKLEGTLYLSTDATINEEVLYSLTMAHAAALNPTGYLTIYSGYDQLSGSSLGLAAYTVMMRKITCALITGAIIPVTNQIFTPDRISSKALLAQEWKTPFITPGDRSVGDHFKKDPLLANYTVDNGDLASGDITATGYVPGIYVVETLAEFMLAVIFSLSNFGSAWDAAPMLQMEIGTVANTAGKTSITYTAKVIETKAKSTNEKEDQKIMREIEEYLPMLITAGVVSPLIGTEETLRDLKKGNYTKNAKSLWITYNTLRSNRDIARQKLLGDLNAVGFSNWSKFADEASHAIKNAKNRVAVGSFVWNPFKEWQAYPLVGVYKQIQAQNQVARSAKPIAPKLMLPSITRPKGRPVYSERVTIPGGELEEEEFVPPKLSREEIEDIENLSFEEPAPAPKVKPGPVPEPTVEDIFGLESEDETKPDTAPEESESEEPAPPPKVVVQSTPAPAPVTKPPPQSQPIAPASDPMSQMLALMQGIQSSINTLTSRVDKIESQKPSAPQTKKAAPKPVPQSRRKRN